MGTEEYTLNILILLSLYIIGLFVWFNVCTNYSACFKICQVFFSILSGVLVLALVYSNTPVEIEGLCSRYAGKIQASSWV